MKIIGFHYRDQSGTPYEITHEVPDDWREKSEHVRVYEHMKHKAEAHAASVGAVAKFAEGIAP